MANQAAKQGHSFLSLDYCIQIETFARVSTGIMQYAWLLPPSIGMNSDKCQFTFGLWFKKLHLNA